MDPIFHIPKDRKPIKPLRLVLLLGMTLLLFLLTANRYSDITAVVLGTYRQ